jgi:hypothetical protein
MKRNRCWWALLVLIQTLLLNGCTPLLWDEKTFAHSYEPAKPANLRLSYSNQKHDVLVAYDEARDGAEPIRHRSYFADQNAARVNNRRKPHFVRLHDGRPLQQIPITNSTLSAASPLFPGLYASSPSEGDAFTLYSKGEALESYDLPRYIGSSRRIKQVLLTPFAVAIDCTIIGAVAAVYWGPTALSAFSGKSF